MPRLVVIVPAVAGTTMFMWALGYVIELVGVCETQTSGTSAWAFAGVALAVLLGIFGAAIVARRLGGWLSLAGAGITVMAMIVGAEIGYAIALHAIECEGWGEGPGLTIAIFSVPAAAFGYVAGWVLGQADQRGSSG